MREYPELPLPEPFNWRNNGRQPGAVDLQYGPYEVASYWPEGDRWRARVAVLWAQEFHREALAESESQARYWCVKWAMREREKIRITRPLSAGFSYAPGLLGNGEGAAQSIWTASDERARRGGNKRGRPGPRL